VGTWVLINEIWYKLRLGPVSVHFVTLRPLTEPTGTRREGTQKFNTAQVALACFS